MRNEQHGVIFKVTRSILIIALNNTHLLQYLRNDSGRILTGFKDNSGRKWFCQECWNDTITCENIALKARFFRDIRSHKADLPTVLRNQVSSGNCKVPVGDFLLRFSEQENYCGWMNWKQATITIKYNRIEGTSVPIKRRCLVKEVLMSMK